MIGSSSNEACVSDAEEEVFLLLITTNMNTMTDTDTL